MNKNQLNFTNLYVKNFGKDMNETKLCQLFSIYGIITSCKIQIDNNGQSKGFGFVNFERSDMAKNAMEKLNGYLLDNGKYLYVAPFQKKSERQYELKRIQEENLNKRSNNLCLYISNLDLLIDENILEIIFSKFGKVTKTHILRNGSQSKGIGFVCFNTIEETQKALYEMNGKWIYSKPIYIKLSTDNPNSQIITPNLSTSSNITYPLIIPTIFYQPAVMMSPIQNNFPSTMNLKIQSPRKYPMPLPSTPTQIKRQIYPYTSVKTDEQ